MIATKASPSDEVPAVITTEVNDKHMETEGDLSAIASVSDHNQKQVHMTNVVTDAGSYSAIKGPPIGVSGCPIGVKKLKWQSGRHLKKRNRNMM